MRRALPTSTIARTIAWWSFAAFSFAAPTSAQNVAESASEEAAAAPAPEPQQASPDDETSVAEGATTDGVAPAESTTTPTLAWTGPRVELGYRIYSLSDSAGGGAVNSATFGGFLPTGALRAGGGLEAGGRAYEYGPTEGLLSGNAFVGYQHLRDLGRVVPYVVAVGELGLLLGKRFHTPVTETLRGAGVEIGADVNVVRSFYLGLGLSYMVYSIEGLAYDTFGLRLSMGL